MEYHKINQKFFLVPRANRSMFSGMKVKTSVTLSEDLLKDMKKLGIEKGIIARKG